MVLPTTCFSFEIEIIDEERPSSVNLIEPWCEPLLDLDEEAEQAVIDGVTWN